MPNRRRLQYQVADRNVLDVKELSEAFGRSAVLLCHLKKMFQKAGYQTLKYSANSDLRNSVDSTENKLNKKPRLAIVVAVVVVKAVQQLQQ